MNYFMGKLGMGFSKKCPRFVSGVLDEKLTLEACIEPPKLKFTVLPRDLGKP